MLIFAYGSNMNLNRLTQRVPSAVKVSNVFLSGYKLICNKISKDGSAKANIIKTDNLAELVCGVIFTINDKEKPLLDKAEGLGIGYNEDKLAFFDDAGNTYTAQVYIADSNAIDNNLLPYDWYKEFIVSGAILNKLPVEYISKLQSITCIPDYDKKDERKTILFFQGSSFLLLPAFKSMCIFDCDAPFNVLFFYHQKDPAQSFRRLY